MLRKRPAITAAQTDGLELRWGNAEAIVRLTEKIGRREGFGDVLADGVWAAWKRLGRIGTEFAVHIQGEEIPAHDPKFTPGLASTYWVTATPGRHTQGGELVAGPGVPVPPADKYVYQGQAEGHHLLVAVVEVVNAAGLCLFGYLSYPFQAVLDQLSAATGDPWDLERVVTTGTRIYTMRHAFNLREGINPLSRNMPGPARGRPAARRRQRPRHHRRPPHARGRVPRPPGLGPAHDRPDPGLPRAPGHGVPGRGHQGGRRCRPA